MKKQQVSSLTGKQLSRNEMKGLKGGIIPGGLWVCTRDAYDCYFYKDECQCACSVPSSCVYSDYCP
jgi:hypothetical protein